ncbi:hypothetical protein E3P91_04132 [Wallemia ichthyophaga]|nr:hypothetical protein E3P91_04132 [Wallemia ichthyophaga]TIB57763.1 hypothetical protein E3P78_04127 [Wallemia ichthyophaga]
MQCMWQRTLSRIESSYANHIKKEDYQDQYSIRIRSNTQKLTLSTSPLRVLQTTIDYVPKILRWFSVIENHQQFRNYDASQETLPEGWTVIIENRLLSRMGIKVLPGKHLLNDISFDLSAQDPRKNLTESQDGRRQSLRLNDNLN